MTSEKAVKANRKNGKLGGVKTLQGKTISKQNSIKHGLCAKNTLLKSENPEEFNDLKQKLYDYYQPKTPIEEILVDKLVYEIWKSPRIANWERSSVDVLIEPILEKIKNLEREKQYFEDRGLDLNGNFFFMVSDWRYLRDAIQSLIRRTFNNDRRRSHRDLFFALSNQKSEEEINQMIIDEYDVLVEECENEIRNIRPNSDTVEKLLRYSTYNNNSIYKLIEELQKETKA